MSQTCIHAIGDAPSFPTCEGCAGVVARGEHLAAREVENAYRHMRSGGVAITVAAEALRSALANVGNRIATGERVARPLRPTLGEPELHRMAELVGRGLARIPADVKAPILISENASRTRLTITLDFDKRGSVLDAIARNPQHVMTETETRALAEDMRRLPTTTLEPHYVSLETSANRLMERARLAELELAMRDDIRACKTCGLRFGETTESGVITDARRPIAKSEHFCDYAPCVICGVVGQPRKQPHLTDGRTVCYDEIACGERAHLRSTD